MKKLKTEKMKNIEEKEKKTELGKERRKTRKEGIME